MYIVVDIIVFLIRLLTYGLEALYRLIFPPPIKNIRGKVVLVTGGARGIGRSIVEHLVPHGAKFAIWDIDEDACIETVEEVKKMGATCYGYKCDITNSDEIAEVAARVRKDLGEVDILVNNAGFGTLSKFLEHTDREIQLCMDVNIIAQYRMVREFLPSMISQKSGHIVTICSMSSHLASHNIWAYTASKFGIHGMMESLQEDLRYMNIDNFINLTSVYPMPVVTRLITTHVARFSYWGRFDKPMSVKEVGEGVSDGLLRNRRYVYIPGYAILSCFYNILPFKSQMALKEFIQSGFYESERVQREY